MRRKKYIWPLLISLLLLPLQSVSSKASVNLQLASAIDWNGISLTKESGFSQVITPQSVPKSPYIGEWSINVGNSYGAGAPLSVSVMLSSQQFANFSFFDVSSDYRFTQNGKTQCTGRTPNAFGVSGTYAVTCSTPLAIVANESYLVEVRAVSGSLNSNWTADLTALSTREKTNLGVISLTSSQSTFNNSVSTTAFNQISIYGPDLTCQNAPSVNSIFSRPKNSLFNTVSFVGTRPAKDCPNAKFNGNSDGSVEVSLGNQVVPLGASLPTYHRGADLEVQFEPLLFNGYTFVELEFTPLSLSGEKVPVNHPMPFAHYGMNWCWQTLESLQGTEVCASLHVRPDIGSLNGNRFNAVVDFFFQNATDISPSDSSVNCELRKQSIFLGVPTYYTTCSRKVSLELGKSYVIQSQKNGVKGVNWWTARLKEKASGEMVDIGSIKTVGTLINIPLARNSLTLAYTGISKECNEVPVLDTLFSPIRGPRSNASIIRTSKGECGQIRFDKTNTKEVDCLPAFCGQYLASFGGKDAQTRNADKYANLTSPSTPGSGQQTINSKPTQPALNQINFVGNKLNINVNIGDGKPDNVFLIAPQLTQEKDGKIAGKVSGSSALWSLVLPTSLSGSLIPIKLISLKSGIESDPLSTQVQVPNLQVGESSLAPKSPQKLRSNFLGAELLVTAQIEISGKAIPKQGFLYAPSVGVGQTKPIRAEIIGNKMIFSIPLKARDRGKTVNYFVYSSNQAGRSPTVSGRYVVPKLPALQAAKPPAVTITCIKGSQLRTFIADKCPPGWTIR